MIHIGIDPGLSGAIAVLFASGEPELRDMPVMGEGRSAQINAAELADLLREWTCGRPAQATIERAHAMPRQGVGSTFAYGRAFGAIEGVCAAVGISVVHVSASVWKRALGIPADKDAARARAVLRMPQLVEHLRLKKHHGRAEALLLALYGREMRLARTVAE